MTSPTNTAGLEVFGHWVEHTVAEPMLIRPPAFCPADGNYTITPLVTAASAQARMAELETERDDADRRAGAAERLLEGKTDSIIKRERWLRDAKEARGYHQNISFDRVWADTCAAADRAQAAEARVDRLAGALERIAGGFPEVRAPHRVTAMRDFARTTLKGADHD